MVSVQDLVIKDLGAMLQQDRMLLDTVAGLAKGTLGDFTLLEKAKKALIAIEFVDKYFSEQDGLDKDLEELGRELPQATYRINLLQCILRFQFNSEFFGELANVICERKKPEQIASQYMTGYNAIFFDVLKIHGCKPNVILPRLAFLRASENLSDVLKSLPDNTDNLKVISAALGMHAIIYRDAIMADS
ncbi:MAG: hypothetical protein HY438_01515 [DPANN group archaeon]|nr:hypothetical protein [DPANN group archaeon]